MKYEIKNKPVKNTESYPRLGLGEGSGKPFIQIEQGGDWFSLCNKVVRRIPERRALIEVLPVGSTITLTQE